MELDVVSLQKPVCCFIVWIRIGEVHRSRFAFQILFFDLTFKCFFGHVPREIRHDMIALSLWKRASTRSLIQDTSSLPRALLDGFNIMDATNLEFYFF